MDDAHAACDLLSQFYGDHNRNPRIHAARNHAAEYWRHDPAALSTFESQLSIAGSAGLRFRLVHVIVVPGLGVAHKEYRDTDVRQISPSHDEGRVMNIWAVGGVVIGGHGRPLAGKSSFPWRSRCMDGILIRRSYLTSAVLVHECAHYLGLLHTFHRMREDPTGLVCTHSAVVPAGILDANGDGVCSAAEREGDMVADTTPQARSLRCRTWPVSMEVWPRNRHGVPAAVFNLLSYSSPDMLLYITAGQAQRIRDVLRHFRPMMYRGVGPALPDVACFRRA